MNIFVWLDDVRDPTHRQWKDLIGAISPVENPEVVWVKSYEEFREYVYNNIDSVIGISFDNDLGEGKEGRHCFSWLEEFLHNTESKKSFTLYAHTANPAARNEINSGILSLQRWWQS